MSRQQVNNLICAVAVIASGLAIMGSERSLRHSVPSESVGQFEGMYTRMLSTNSAVPYTNYDNKLYEPKGIKVVDPFPYSIAFAHADAQLDDYEKFLKGYKLLLTARSTSFDDYMWDPARAQERQHQDNVVITTVAISVILFLLCVIFLPSILNGITERKTGFNKKDYDDFVAKKYEIGDKLRTIREKIKLHEGNKEYCDAMVPLADNIEEIMKIIEAVDNGPAILERKVNMTPEELMAEIHKKVTSIKDSTVILKKARLEKLRTVIEDLKTEMSDRFGTKGNDELQRKIDFAQAEFQELYQFLNSGKYQ